jgi:hypothetical protein
MNVYRTEMLRYRKALETILQDYGKVCKDYMECTHVACASSVGAWFIADEALHPRAYDVLRKGTLESQEPVADS